MHIRELFDLTGMVALVTGGSRGLGHQMACALGEGGASVVLAARTREALEAAAAELAGQGIRAVPVVCDVTHPDDVNAAVARTLKEFGQIDILVNNAGTAWGAPAVEMPLDAWRRVLETNVTGTFLMAQAVGRTMIERDRGGTIINVASIAGMRGADPRVLDAIGYSTSKGGVIALTRDLAVKWAHHSITVNAIAPGFFPSQMTRWVIERRQEAILNTIPLGRLGGDDDLKGVVVFLASRAARFVTGQVLAVDGGATAR
ncbi:MAG TPA: SDR family oxidoreductase [bacterium]|nr:SDR family oxidoreductase [bacterium]